MNVDIAVEIPNAVSIAGLIAALSDHLEFGEHVQFDRLPWLIFGNGASPTAPRNG